MTVAFTEWSWTPRFDATVATPAVRHDASAASAISGGVATVVLGGEDFWVVSVDRVGLTVHVLRAEAGEVGDRGAATRN